MQASYSYVPVFYYAILLLDRSFTLAFQSFP